MKGVFLFQSRRTSECDKKKTLDGDKTSNFQLKKKIKNLLRALNFVSRH